MSSFLFYLYCDVLGLDEWLIIVAGKSDDHRSRYQELNLVKNFNSPTFLGAFRQESIKITSNYPRFETVNLCAGVGYLSSTNSVPLLRY